MIFWDCVSLIFQELKTLMSSDCQLIGLPANFGLCRRDVTVRKKCHLFSAVITPAETFVWTWMQTWLIVFCLFANPPSQFIWWMSGTWSKPFVTTGSTHWTTMLKSMCHDWRLFCLPFTTSSTSGCPPPTRSMWNSPLGSCSTSWWPHMIGME